MVVSPREAASVSDLGVSYIVIKIEPAYIALAFNQLRLTPVVVIAIAFISWIFNGKTSIWHSKIT